MKNLNVSPTMLNCVFKKNFGNGDGGGAVFNANSNASYYNCIFDGNFHSSKGGAMLNQNSNVVLVNCLFKRNLGIENGGSIYMRSGKLSLVNCTFANNTAGNEGGAIYYTDGEEVYLVNCILWQNNGIQLETKELAGNSTLVKVNYSCIEGGLFGAKNENPNLINDYECIANNSHCKDQGDPAIAKTIFKVINSNGSEIDLWGNERFRSRIDMGVCEIQ